MTAPLRNHGSGHHRRRSGPTTATAAVAATSGSSSTRIPHVTGRTPHNIIHVPRTALATPHAPCAANHTHYPPRAANHALRTLRTTHHAPRVTPFHATRFITWARSLHDSRLPAYGYVCVLPPAGARATRTPRQRCRPPRPVCLRRGARECGPIFRPVSKLTGPPYAAGDQSRIRLRRRRLHNNNYYYYNVIYTCGIRHSPPTDNILSHVWRWPYSIRVFSSSYFYATRRRPPIQYYYYIWP